MNSVKKKPNDILITYFPDLFDNDKKEIIINNNHFSGGKLIINRDKTKFFNYKNGLSIKNMIKRINKTIKPSDIFVDTLDNDELELENEPPYAYNYLQQNLFKINNKYKIYEGFNPIQFIDELTNVDIINIYSYWKIILQWANENDLFDEIASRIDLAINDIVAINVNNMQKNLHIIKETLNNELKFIKELVIGKYKEFQISDINQEDIFNKLKQIDNVTNNKNNLNIEYDLFPVDIPLYKISCYLSLTHKLNSEEDIINKSKEFFIINNGYSCNEPVINYEANGRIIKFILNNNINENKKIIRVAIASIYLPESTIEKMDLIKRDFIDESVSLNDYYHLIDSASKSGANYILFPELALPFKYVFSILDFCKKKSISIITGLTHFIDKENKIARNLSLIYDCNLNLAILKEKNYYAPEERICCAKYGYQTNNPQNSNYVIINNSELTYSVMTCYETTNIIDRALLCDKIEMLFIPVYNKDTTYFSNIISSFCRDASCFVAQANNNEYGDSRISGPYKHLEMDIIKLKGGENNYYVLGEIMLADLKELELIENEIDNKVDSLLATKKCTIGETETKVKKLSAGNKRIATRRQNKIS